MGRRSKTGGTTGTNQYQTIGRATYGDEPAVPVMVGTATEPIDEWHTAQGLLRDPTTSRSVDEIRSKLSGLHLAQESLTRKEREILALGEATLRILDHLSPSGYAR